MQLNVDVAVDFIGHGEKRVARLTKSKREPLILGRKGIA